MHVNAQELYYSDLTKRNTAETAVCTGKIHDGIRRIRPPKVRKMGNSPLTKDFFFEHFPFLVYMGYVIILPQKGNAIRYGKQLRRLERI